jgi:hypothetical protein
MACIGHMAAYGACLTMMLWGIVAAICFSPAWVGWAGMLLILFHPLFLSSPSNGNDDDLMMDVIMYQ